MMYKTLWGAGTSGINKVYFSIGDLKDANFILEKIFKDTMAADVKANSKLIERTWKNSTMKN